MPKTEMKALALAAVILLWVVSTAVIAIELYRGETGLLVGLLDRARSACDGPDA